MLRTTASFSVALLLLVPLFVDGHAIGFKSLTTTTEEGYVVDFGYEEATLREQVTTRLSFELYDNEATSTLSSFTEVWVLVKSPEQGTVFSGGIDRPEFGDTSISFTFPQDGEYEIQLRFQEDSRILARGNFTLTVPPAEDTGAGTTALLFFGAAMGLLVGFVIAFFIRRKGRGIEEEY